MTRLADLSRLMGAAALLATLAACGGGGGGGEAPAPAPAPAPAAATQGFWSGRVDAQTTASGVFLADGPAMLVLQSNTASTLVMGMTANNANAFTLSGRSYGLGTGGSSAYSSSGTVVPKSTLDIGAAGNTPAYQLAYNAAYERPAQLSDIAGRWVARFSGGTLTLTLDFAANGAVSGTNTSGCTYSGTVAPHGNVAVFDLSLREACVGTAAVQFNGYATLNEARTTLSVGAVSSDQATATAFQATR